MTHKLATLVCNAMLLAACVLSARAGDILDRVVATVNGHVILQSDWEDAVRSEAFIAGRTLDQVTANDQKAALDRLIDQELLKEQMRASEFQIPSQEEIGKRLQEVRKQYPGTDSDRGWQGQLARYGLTEAELKDRITDQLNLTRLVDVRLRPNVSIDAKSIESYYNQELLPQLRHSGGKEVALSEVSPQIKELLTQQQVNQLLTTWLRNLRASSEIRTLSAVPETGSQVQ
jgi:peptidyl-prolyl cis-trans isomerase SurA